MKGLNGASYNLRLDETETNSVAGSKLTGDWHFYDVQDREKTFYRMNKSSWRHCSSPLEYKNIKDENALTYLWLTKNKVPWYRIFHLRNTFNYWQRCTKII